MRIKQVAGVVFIEGRDLVIQMRTVNNIGCSVAISTLDRGSGRGLGVHHAEPNME